VFLAGTDHALPLRCRFGLHVWDKNVAMMDRSSIKKTGFDWSFAPGGIQKGIQHCTLCGSTRVVYREGWITTAGSDPEGSSHWHYCSPEREHEIDKLPPL
jgi:hypothetical protein